MMLTPFDFKPWCLISYQFIHASLMHLLGNMLFLYIFGPSVEDKLRRLGFLAFYIVGGMIGGGLHALFEESPVVGASGSISAVTGAFLVLFPLTHVRILIFFILIGVYSFPSWIFIGFAIAKDFVYQGDATSNIAHLAHLGGYGFGMGVCLVLLWLKILPREPYDLLSIARQAKRRREFKELTSKGNTAWSRDVPKENRVTRSPKPNRHVEERDARVSELRSEISQKLAVGDLGGASRSYSQLLNEYPGVVLSRDAQIQIGNYLFRSGQHQSAAGVYSLFVERYPKDREVDQIKLLLATLSARYLNDPVHAKGLLSEIKFDALDDEHRRLATVLRSELG